MTHPIGRFPTPPLKDMPEDIAARIRKVAGKSGCLPNALPALAYRPDEFRAFSA
jgi:hypothetical protein